MAKFLLLSALCLSVIYAGFTVLTNTLENTITIGICGDAVDGGHPMILTGDPVPGGGVPRSSNLTRIWI